MKLEAVAHALRMRLAGPLPGNTAHDLMRAVPVGNIMPKFQHQLPARPGGVLILLYEEGDTIKFPLIRRQEYVGAHSGQISLPGGKSEPGENTLQTALREAEEEVGVDRSLPVVLGSLSDFFVIPSNFIVTPVVAALNTAPEFRADPHEVASILTFSLDDLLRDDAILTKEIIAAGSFRMMAPHFLVHDAMVWGATAMMLNEFRVILKEALNSV